MPCRFASSGTVATSRSASRAILALNVASNFLRDLVISVLHRLRQSRTLHTLTFGPISGVHFKLALRVIEKRHESEVHMQLLMTVKQGPTGIVGHKIHFDLLVAAQHDDILHDPVCVFRAIRVSSKLCRCRWTGCISSLALLMRSR